MTSRRHNNGDRVLAKWPGTNLYFAGTVTDYNDIEYLVQFEDEDDSRLAIKFKEVQSFRSRSRSRGRSPARSSAKSPARGRSPGRSKSPARKAAPAPKKETKAPTTRGSKSPSRSKRTTTTTSSSISSTSNNSSITSTSSSISTATAAILSAVNSKSAADEAKQLLTPIRQSARLASIEQNNILTSTLINNAANNGNNIAKSSSRISCGSSIGCKLSSCLSCVWSLVWPALVSIPTIVFITAMPLIMTQCCTKKKCTILEFPELPRKLESYYDPVAVGITLAGLALNFLLAFVPVKSKVLPNGAKARGNAMVTLLVCCLLVPLCVYLKINVQQLYTMQRPLLCSHLAVALLLSLLLYAKAHYSRRSQINPSNSGHFLLDLLSGKEISPRLGSVDLKSYLYRYMCVLTVIFSIVVIMRNLQLSKAGVYNEPLLLVCAMTILMCVDHMWFEDTLYTTYSYVREGTGFVQLHFALILPFYWGITYRLILNYKPSMPWYSLVGCGLLWFIGYLLHRCSTNQKHAFRTNPSSPHLAHLESVPTSAGSRLLVSGWWGAVRHPNYLGAILRLLAIVLLTGFSHGLSWVFFGCNMLSIFKALYENEKACRAKYGLSWSNYTGRIKYMLIPKIF